MLAAHFRRASRVLLGLAVVAVLGAGLSLAPPWALESAAVAAENTNNTVSVSVFPTSGAAISEGQ
ncbi:MAG: hypothetical protein JJE28_06915, partial [Actinomycetales bacterium]|nr:hypothetical protein [Actinomycetales bacterium]